MLLFLINLYICLILIHFCISLIRILGCSVVAFRSANKLGFYAYVTPNINLSRDAEIWTSFAFKYDHHGTVPVAQMLKSSEGERKPEVVLLDQTVFINLGRVKDSQ